MSMINQTTTMDNQTSPLRDLTKAMETLFSNEKPYKKQWKTKFLNEKSNTRNGQPNISMRSQTKAMDNKTLQ